MDLLSRTSLSRLPLSALESMNCNEKSHARRGLLDSSLMIQETPGDLMTPALPLRRLTSVAMSE